MNQRVDLFDSVRPFAPDRKFSDADVKILDLLAAKWGVPEDEVAAPVARQMRDKEAFYKGVRGVTGSLDQIQVDVIEALLSSASHWPTSWLACGFATAWHEARLKPIEEWGKGKGRKYGLPGKYGQSQHGRGLVQLTWDFNYEKADKELGLGGRLLKDFNLALEPDIAVKILVRGMEEGWFTGKKLADYLPDELGTDPQFIATRRIINGVDKAVLIAGHARLFQDACKAGGWA